MIVIDDHKPQPANAPRAAVAFADGGLPDLFQWLEATPRRWRQDDSESQTGSHTWDLNAGWRGALAMARDGWSDGARDLANKLAVALPAKASARRWTYDVAGERPHIARHLAGDPRAMARRGKDAGRKPVLHLIVNTCASASVTAQAMANYGAALVAMIDRIEATGRQIELDVMNAARLAGDSAYAYGWNVKKAGDPVDLAAVAFSIGHPAAFRRLGFALMERSPAGFEHYDYGTPAKLTPEHLPEPNPAAVLLDGIGQAEGRCHNMADALAFAAEQINKAVGFDLVSLTD